MNLNATLFAQLVVFFILAWFTMQFVWPPIVKALDERAKKIADGLAAAERGKQDLELATKRSNDNPVYYIQYAHARVSSVLRQLADRGLVHDLDQGLAALGRLVEPQEQSLAAALARYPELLDSAAAQRAPHLLVHYLRELANEFHSYYNAHAFIVEDAALRNARLALVLATRQVLRNGLAILGVGAPESM